jgi:hypothetical protein
MGKLNKKITAVKNWTYKYIGGMLMEEKKNGDLAISLGRVSFVSVLLVMMWYWIAKSAPADGEPKLPDGLFETFVTLAGYIFGTKVTSVLKSKMEGGLSK